MKNFTNKIIVANWKMNGSPEMAKAWAAEMRALLVTNNQQPATIIVCPPSPLIFILKGKLNDLPISFGGQDCHADAAGAYTGDISADLLKDLGAEYVIVGHSERREACGETSEIVCVKAARTLEIGLIPIICIGETAQQRDAGETLAVLAQQVKKSVPENWGAEKIILAYEPVWAIGSGNLPTSDEIKTAHQAIISETAKHTGLAEEQVYVLYGGSVKPENAHEIMKIAGVAGVLVGGASLKAGEFYRISECGV